MRITRVETLPSTIGNRTYVYVKVHTDEGIVGVGEAACSDKEKALFGAIEELHQYLIGSNPFEIERLWTLMYRHSFWRYGPVLCLHLDTVVPNFLIQEQIVRPEHRDMLTAPADVVRDGYMEPPRGPGWGVDLNEEYLRAHPYQEGRMFPLELAEDGSPIDL